MEGRDTKYEPYWHARIHANGSGRVRKEIENDKFKIKKQMAERRGAGAGGRRGKLEGQFSSADPFKTATKKKVKKTRAKRVERAELGGRGQWGKR